MGDSILQTIHESYKVNDRDFTAKERIVLRELERKGLVRTERKFNDMNIFWKVTRKAENLNKP